MGFKLNTSGTIVEGKKIFVNHNGTVKPVFYVTGNNNGALVVPNIDFDVIANVKIECGYGYYYTTFSSYTGGVPSTAVTTSNLNVSGNYINFSSYNNRFQTAFRFSAFDSLGRLINQIHLPPGYRIGFTYSLYMSGSGNNNRTSLGTALWSYTSFIPTSFSFPYSTSGTYIEPVSSASFNVNNTSGAGLISISAESWGGSSNSGYVYLSSFGIYNASGGLVKNIPFTISPVLPTFTVI